MSPGMSRAWRLGGIVTMLSGAALAVAADLPESTRAALTRALGELPQGTEAALVVMDPRDDRILFDHRGAQPLKPASVMKVMVTAAALDWFGPDAAFTTEFLLTGDELLVLGGGDPGLGDERLAARRGHPPLEFLDKLSEQLKARGVTRLAKIALDDGIFDQVHRHASWDVNQWDRWYAAPVGGLILADNCVEFAARVADGRVTITTTPTIPDSFIENELTIGKKATARLSRRPHSDIFR
jgi:D-alanyl-D-alanine carboxypeptidase/D-alanyl-D-alanine-endopeptidase (penicillin-binding protein 4)